MLYTHVGYFRYFSCICYPNHHVTVISALHDWQWLLISALVPMFLCLALRFCYTFESPTFLASAGQIEACTSILEHSALTNGVEPSEIQSLQFLKNNSLENSSQPLISNQNNIQSILKVRIEHFKRVTQLFYPIETGKLNHDTDISAQILTESCKTYQENCRNLLVVFAG